MPLDVPIRDLFAHESSTEPELSVEKAPTSLQQVQVTVPPHLVLHAPAAENPPVLNIVTTIDEMATAHATASPAEEEDEDLVYMPAQFQGDGRKREAKRHKSRTVVPQDEINLEGLIRDYQTANPKIQELEQSLEELKTLKISKRELQSQRNRFTAQLSRDRQKLELTYLKSQAINY